jgi:hypothetical protein
LGKINFGAGKDNRIICFWVGLALWFFAGGRRTVRGANTHPCFGVAALYGMRERMALLPPGKEKRKQIPHSTSLRAGSAGMTTRKAKIKTKTKAKTTATAQQFHVVERAIFLAAGG